MQSSPPLFCLNHVSVSQLTVSGVAKLMEDMVLLMHECLTFEQEFQRRITPLVYFAATCVAEGKYLFSIPSRIDHTDLDH